MGWKSHWKKCVPLPYVIKFHKYFSCSACVLSVPHILRFYIYLQIIFVENCKYWSSYFVIAPFFLLVSLNAEVFSSALCSLFRPIYVFLYITTYSTGLCIFVVTNLSGLVQLVSHVCRPLSTRYCEYIYSRMEETTSRSVGQLRICRISVDAAAVWRIISKIILKKYDITVWIEFMWFTTEISGKRFWIQ
jgi:hypothetical protein